MLSLLQSFEALGTCNTVQAQGTIPCIRRSAFIRFNKSITLEARKQALNLTWRSKGQDLPAKTRSKLSHRKATNSLQNLRATRKRHSTNQLIQPSCGMGHERKAQSDPNLAAWARGGYEALSCSFLCPGLSPAPTNSTSKPSRIQK